MKKSWRTQTDAMGGECCASTNLMAFPLSSAKTHKREAAGEDDGRGIVERHGWMEMCGRGGGLALAR